MAKMGFISGATQAAQEKKGEDSPAEQKAKLDEKVAEIVQTKEAIFKALERGKGNVADLPTGVENKESTGKVPGRS